MTIDEAIAREKELAEIYRNDIVPKEDYHNMPWIDMVNEGNEKAAEEHEHLAEWLEELKEIKSNGRYVQGNKAGQKIGYRNAIDDYNKELKEYLRRFNVHYVSDADFDYVAEQLKAGVRE